MTEAVFLALIALVGVMMFLATAVLIIKDVLKSAPSHFKLETEFGQMEIDFDTKVDE